MFLQLTFWQRGIEYVYVKKVISPARNNLEEIGASFGCRAEMRGNPNGA